MKKYNLVVVGGGFFGVVAALVAAREGVEVLLVEKGKLSQRCCGKLPGQSIYAILDNY